MDKKHLKFFSKTRLNMLPSFFIVFFLLLCNLSLLHCQPHDTSKRVEFQPDLKTDFDHIAIDQNKNGLIYIGATNYLFQLTDDLRELVTVKTGPDNRKDNINKILLIDGMGRRLVVCGSVKQGTCELRSLKNINKTLYSPDFGTLSTKQYVAASGNLSTVAFIASSPTDNLTFSMYVGSSKTMKDSNINSDPPFYSVSKRKLLPRNNNNEMFSLSYFDDFIWDDVGIMMKREKANQGFRLTFIDGFAIGKTGYFVSTHPSPSNERVEETYISQMCLKESYGLRSYLELPITCNANGLFYTQAIASRTVKVGSTLAQSLGLPMTFVDQVVFISFINPNQLDQGSAVCVFPLRTIEENFLSLVKQCMKGSTPLAEHISWIEKTNLECGVGNFQDIQSPVCNKEGLWDVAQYLQEKALYKSQAVYTSKEIITAIESTVTQSKKDTVAFLGTQSGKMLKVQIVSTNKHLNRLYDTVVVATSEEAFLLPNEAPDLSVSVKSIKIGHTKASRIYIVTPNVVVGLPLYNCSMYKDCTSCLKANDPFCGWLTLESKCSKMISTINDYRFILTDGQCPKLTVDGSANSSIETSQKQIYLKSDNIPQTDNSNRKLDYFCTFGDDVDPPRCDITFVDKPGYLSLRCCTPPSQFISIPPGQTSLSTPLSLRYRSGSTSNVVVSTDYTFYDCEAFTSCLTCISSGFKCQWCMYQKICSDSDLSQCGNRIKVINENGNCPSQQGFKEDKGPISNTTYLSVDSRREIKIRTQALPQSTVSRYECEIERPDGAGIPLIVPGNQQGQDIVCQPFTINLDAKQRSSVVGLKVIWINLNNNQRQPLDNPNSLQIEVYRCPLTGDEDNCGTCRASSQHWKCGWCEKSKNCSLYDNCSQGTNWIPATPGRVCTHPKITKFFPTSAPIHTTTDITVQGINFNVRNNMKITIANWSCTNIEPVDADGCCTIRCSVRPNMINEGTIKFCITNGNSCLPGPSYNTESDQKLLFVEPKTTTFSPTTALHGWGTRITIYGEHLNAGNSVEVTIGTTNCKVDRSTLKSNSLECDVQWSENSRRRRRHSRRHPRSSNILHRMFRARRDVTAYNDQHIQLSFNGFIKAALSPIRMYDDVMFTSMSPNTTLLSGGLPIVFRGINLGYIQKPLIKVVKGKEIFSSICDNIGDKNAIRCLSPDISKKIYKAVDARVVIASQLEGLPTSQLKAGILQYKLNPKLNAFEGEDRTKTYRKDQLYIEGTGLCADRLHCNTNTVRIMLGDKTQCNVTRLDYDQVACQPPLKLVGKYPVVVNIGGYSQQVGYLEYPKEEGTFPISVIVVIIIIVIFALIVAIVCVWKYRKHSKQNDEKVKNMQIKMNVMESKVAKVCKEAFAELQTDMTDFDAASDAGIPYLDYRIYLMRVLFPDPNSAKKQHNLLLSGQNFYYNGKNDSRTNSNRPLPPHGGRSVGMHKFDQLLENKCFLMCFIRTIESKNSFTMKDKSMVAGLLLVIFQNRLPYATEILEQLLADLIRKNMEGKNHPKLLLRRTESVAEKMLTHWLSILLYRFVNECAGEPLFMLYRAIKQQVNKGPIDMFTNEARYSLSEDKLLRQTVDHEHLTLQVCNYLGEHDQSDFSVKVLSCDSISQVKRKILDIAYMNVPYSQRPPPEAIDLEWRQGRLENFVLKDEDNTSKVDGEWRQVNTLSHYSVPDGAMFSIIPRSDNTLNHSTMSGHSKASGHRQNGSGARLLPLTEGSNTSLPRYKQQSRSGTPTLPQDGSLPWHLVKQSDQEHKEGSESKMVSEIYLTRLLTTKGTIQKYVDDLFETIFSTMQRGHALPMAVKHIFDFLDHQADIHGITDPEIVHTWKNNCLPLRFWVNLIKNPNFVFDIPGSRILDCYLSVIAQAFMDSCSTAEYKLSHESPSNKLLYAKDIPTYRKWVKIYYADVSNMPKLNPRDMSQFLMEESYVHTNDFNTHEALSQLYKYVETYSDDILLVLDSDKEARRQRLLDKLEEVSASINNSDKLHI